MIEARKKQVDKIAALKEELRRCQKGTPHWRDVSKHLKREQKALLIYDRLQKQC